MEETLAKFLERSSQYLQDSHLFWNRMCATQVNAIANVVEENTGVQGWIVGLVVAILTAIVIFEESNLSLQYVRSLFRLWLSFM